MVQASSRVKNGFPLKFKWFICRANMLLCDWLLNISCYFKASSNQTEHNYLFSSSLCFCDTTSQLVAFTVLSKLGAFFVCLSCLLIPPSAASFFILYFLSFNRPWSFQCSQQIIIHSELLLSAPWLHFHSRGGQVWTAQPDKHFEIFHSVTPLCRLLACCCLKREINLQIIMTSQHLICLGFILSLECIVHF